MKDICNKPLHLLLIALLVLLPMSCTAQRPEGTADHVCTTYKVFFEGGSWEPHEKELVWKGQQGQDSLSIFYPLREDPLWDSVKLTYLFDTVENGDIYEALHYTSYAPDDDEPHVRTFNRAVKRPYLQKEFGTFIYDHNAVWGKHCRRVLVHRDEEGRIDQLYMAGLPFLGKDSMGDPAWQYDYYQAEDFIYNQAGQMVLQERYGAISENELTYFTEEDLKETYMYSYDTNGRVATLRRICKDRMLEQELGIRCYGVYYDSLHWLPDDNEAPVAKRINTRHADGSWHLTARMRKEHPAPGTEITWYDSWDEDKQQWRPDRKNTVQTDEHGNEVMRSYADILENGEIREKHVVLHDYKYDAKGRITEEIISGKDLALNPDDKLRPKEKRVYTYRK